MSYLLMYNTFTNNGFVTFVFIAFRYTESVSLKRSSSLEMTQPKFNPQWCILYIANVQRCLCMITQEGVGDELRHLIARSAQLREVRQLPVQHSLELEKIKRENHQSKTPKIFSRAAIFQDLLNSFIRACIYIKYRNVLWGTKC